MKNVIENKLNLPNNKMYFEFFGTDNKSAGIAFYESESEAMQDCLELIKSDVDLLPRVKFVETTKAIEIINERANNNFEFPMDSGDSFFRRN
jgi:hypothetical protein